MKIFGTIKNEKDQPLEGAHVRMKLFNTIGVYTDSKGLFLKDSPAIKDTDEILISYVGYETISVLAKDLQGKKITMFEAITELNEVVVTPDDLVSSEGKGIIVGTKHYNPTKEFFQKHKTPISIIGALSLITASFFLIKKTV